MHMDVVPGAVELPVQGGQSWEAAGASEPHPHHTVQCSLRGEGRGSTWPPSAGPAPRDPSPGAAWPPSVSASGASPTLWCPIPRVSTILWGLGSEQLAVSRGGRPGRGTKTGTACAAWVVGGGRSMTAPGWARAEE